MGIMFRVIVLSVLVLLARGIEAKADVWQQTLQSKFDIVETFNDLQDWGANGLNPSGAGGTVPYDLALLPKKLDGSPSIWGYWNNKTPTAIVGPIANGAFAAGEVIENGKGALLKHQKTHVIDGVTYVQMGWVTGSVGKFSIGDTLKGQTSGATAVLTGWPKIIANHGANSWKGSGKSLLMNFGDNDNSAAMAGIGAQRLGTFFGNGITGKSGYKKIHVFMMVKFAPKFFGLSGAPSDVNYVRVFKFFDLCSGFTSIKRFGSDADQPFIEQGNPQVQIEYGANDSIINLNGGGLSYPGRAYFTENIGTAILTPDSNPPTYYIKTSVSNKLFNNDSSYPSNGTDVNRFNPLSAGGEWFGIEVMSDIGTMGNADAATEFWVYDKLGNVRGHYLATGQSKLVQFDHYYNKITLGGNRRTGTDSSGLDGRFWIDDVIVDGTRIGPSYFQLMGGVEAPDTSAPTVSITAPVANSSVSGITEVSASALDNISVSKVEFYLNGTLLGTDSASPFAVAWNTGSSPGGSYTLQAKAYDAAGNVGQSAIVPVSVSAGADVTAPVITSFVPTAGTYRFKTAIRIAGTATDAIAMSQMRISVDGVYTSTANGGAITYYWKPTSKGNHEFRIFAYDKAGNYSVKSVNVTIK